MTEQTVEQMLAEFIRTTKASLDPRMWANLIREEKAELEEALEGTDKEHILKELTDLMYVTIGFNMVAAGAEQIGLIHQEEHEELMKLLKDAQEVHTKGQDAVGSVNWLEAFTRVHKNNMGRVFQSDGTIKRREDGKILKNPDYPKVVLKDLIPTKAKATELIV